jgi:hypothetical protein
MEPPIFASRISTSFQFILLCEQNFDHGRFMIKKWAANAGNPSYFSFVRLIFVVVIHIFIVSDIYIIII